MKLIEWIAKTEGKDRDDADKNAAKILGIKPRTAKAIRLMQMRPDPEVAFMIADKLKGVVTFEECYFRKSDIG